MSLVTPSTGRAATTGTTATTGRNAQKAKWVSWANTGFGKSIQISDWAAGYINGVSNAFGAERFWPSSGDYVEEINKCVRILNGFTKQGFVREEEQVVPEDDPSGSNVVLEQIFGPDGTPITKEEAAKLKPEETRTEKITRHIKKVKIVHKIPSEVLKKAKGIAIYTSMRSGMAPFGGSGGSGLVMARLPDGSWSAPSFITPQNASVGLMFGLDVYDVVLVIMSDAALEGFKTHKVALGAETAIAAGPVGTGASMDLSVNGVDWTNSNAQVPAGEKKKIAKPPAPIFSYTRNRGFYAGFEGMAMIYLTRIDENERVYHWPGVSGRDVLEGKVHKPPEARALYDALAAAESGEAQATRSNLEEKTDTHQSPQSFTREMVLDDGERIEVPLTPEEAAELELMGIKNTLAEEREAEDYKAYIWSMPEPPRHPAALARAGGIARTKAGNRFVAPVNGTSSRPTSPSSSRFLPPDPSTSTLADSRPDHSDPAPGPARSQSLASTSISTAAEVDTPPAYSASPRAGSLALAVEKGLMVSEPEEGDRVHDHDHDENGSLPLGKGGLDYRPGQKINEYLGYGEADLSPTHAAGQAPHATVVSHRLFDEKVRPAHDFDLSAFGDALGASPHDEVHGMAPIAL